MGGSDPNSTRGIRKNGFDHLEIRPSAVLHSFFLFWTPALKAATGTNPYEFAGNMLLSLCSLAFDFNRLPKHRQLRAFTTFANLTCCAVCAREGANERFRAAAGTSARAPWVHARRRASGEASQPPRSRWRCSGSACHGRRAPSRKSSRRSHEPLMRSLLVSEWAFEMG